MFGVPFRRKSQSFRADERGSMTILALTLLSAAALLGGLAVDVMRFENRRTLMQTALDLCVLNAASLRQTLNETTLFNDCVRKAGMTGTVTKLTVTEGYSSKSVSASAEEVVNTMFLGMIGMDTLKVTAVSSAMERVGNVEVSLVLDVSGSMAGTRLTNMKAAAKDFVRTLLSDDSEGRVLITLVPYNGQVNLGDYLAQKYTVTNTPFNSTNIPDVRNVRCVDLPSTAYAGTAISRTLSLPATTYVDTYSTTWTSGYAGPTDSNYALPSTANMWCPATGSAVSGNVVRLRRNQIQPITPFCIGGKTAGQSIGRRNQLVNCQRAEYALVDKSKLHGFSAPGKSRNLHACKFVFFGSRGSQQHLTAHAKVANQSQLAILALDFKRQPQKFAASHYAKNFRAGESTHEVAGTSRVALE